VWYRLACAFLNNATIDGHTALHARMNAARKKKE
jgi:hypothetical protein